jgi:hypothetical protein
MRPFEESHAFDEHSRHEEKKKANQYHTENTENTEKRILFQKTKKHSATPVGSSEHSKPRQAS